MKDLSRNYLLELPESIGSATTLETLNVAFNKLQCLPFAIGRLSLLHSSSQSIRCSSSIVFRTKRTVASSPFSSPSSRSTSAIQSSSSLLKSGFDESSPEPLFDEGELKKAMEELQLRSPILSDASDGPELRRNDPFLNFRFELFRKKPSLFAIERKKNGVVVDGNPLKMPPKEVLKEGSDAIVLYLFRYVCLSVLKVFAY